MPDDTDIPVPGGEVHGRTLQFFWITDSSTSMSGKKIAVLNQAIRDAVPFVREAVRNHPEVKVNMRAVSFDSTARWHVGPQETPLESFVWPHLMPSGSTATDQAIDMVIDALDPASMPKRNAAPVCILVSDGYCDDSDAYEAAIARLKANPFGKRSVRLAIAVKDEAGYADAELLKFVSHPEVGVLHADTPQQLVAYIRWASVAATVGASAGKSAIAAAGGTGPNVTIATPPPQVTYDPSTDDVF